MSNETGATPKLFRIDEVYGNVYMWDTTAMAYIYYCKVDCFEEDAPEDESSDEQLEYERQMHAHTDGDARREVESSLHDDGIIEPPETDGGLMG